MTDIMGRAWLLRGLVVALLVTAGPAELEETSGGEKNHFGIYFKQHDRTKASKTTLPSFPNFPSFVHSTATTSSTTTTASTTTPTT